MFADMTLMEIAQALLPLIIIQLIVVVITLRALIKADQVKFMPKWAWGLIIIVLSNLAIGPVIFLLFGREKEV